MSMSMYMYMYRLDLFPSLIFEKKVKLASGLCGDEDSDKGVFGHVANQAAPTHCV